MTAVHMRYLLSFFFQGKGGNKPLQSDKPSQCDKPEGFLQVERYEAILFKQIFILESKDDK